MSYLVDTNVLSELRKGDRTNAGVARWFADVKDADLFTSVLVVGELRKGVEQLRRRERRRAEGLDAWLRTLVDRFGSRVLTVDARIAEQWGAVSAVRPLSVVDGLLAATAIVHGLTFVTRNARDVAGTGAVVLDPFS